MRRVSPAGVAGRGRAGGAHAVPACRRSRRRNSQSAALRERDDRRQPTVGNQVRVIENRRLDVPSARPADAPLREGIARTATTNSFGTCDMPLRNGLRPGSGVLRRAATGCAMRASWTRTVLWPRFAGRVALLPGGEPPGDEPPGDEPPQPRVRARGGAARANSRLDNHDLAIGRQGETSFTGCPLPVYAAAVGEIGARARNFLPARPPSGNLWSCPPRRPPVRHH